MKRNIFTLILVAVTCFNSCAWTQSTNSEKQIIEMLKEFYTTYNNVWSIKPPLTNDVLNSKLDSLMIKCCTLKLRNEAKKYLEDGHDLLTNDFPGIHSFENLIVEKDSKNENGYIVRYTTSNLNASRRLVEQKVVLHVIVVKASDSYKINEVK